jgi:hypothetical protein
MRMEDNVPCRKKTFSQLEGSKKKGRPRLRWLHLLFKALRALEVNALQ